MGRSEREIQTPGADIPQPHPQLAALTALNNADMDYNEQAIQHESRATAAQIAALMEAGDYEGVTRVTQESVARIQELKSAGRADPVPAAVLEQFGDTSEIEQISVPTVRRSPDVDKYGPELPWPAGTPLNADKKPCEGGETPHYYVANIQLKTRGWLVSRAVRVAPHEEAA